MIILCTVDITTREVTIPSDQRIASYDHKVDVIRFQVETIPGFSLDTSTIRIAAQGPNKARHDYAVDPSTVQIEEETGYITFDWPIPAGVTEMPIGTFKYGDKGQLIFAVCAEIISGDTVSKAWHSDDGIITVVAHLEPESGGGEDPEEEATNAQKIAQLQTDVAVINTQVGALANGSPTPVATVAEMTDESAVYLYTGSETGYTAGNWYYYNGSAWTSGGTYGGAVTSTTFNQHGVPADDFAVGQALAEKADADDVTALDNRVTVVEDKTDAVVGVESSSETVDVDMSGLQRVTGKKINTSNNLIDGSESYSVVWVQVPYTGNITVVSSTASQLFGRIYNNITDSTDITSANWAQSLQAGEQSNTKIGTVEAGQYLVVVAWSSSFTISATVETEGEETYMLKQDIGLTDAMETEVDGKIADAISGDVSSAINSAGEALYSNAGWKTLPVSDFEAGGYTSYTGKDSRKYRVRYTKVLSFDRDITILADAGFYAEIFRSNGTDSGASTTINVPANTEFKVFVRRISEDSSETADITTFANALKISTPLADMERYADTFTDLSMFPRIGICGDSYASGGGIISGVRPLTWGKNLERQIGSVVDIYAKSGQNVVQWVTDSTNGLVALLAGEECGLYWLAHGINGTSTDELIGTPADMSENPRPATFYGQYAEAVEQIKTAFPDAKIVLQTITGTSYRLYQASQYTKVNTAIRAIAEYCEVPVIDVVDDEFYKSRWYADSMRSNHPTAMLNAGIAHANRRLFARCVMANPAYFVDFGS